MATKILGLIAIILIIIVYVSYYAKYNTQINIVQTYIDKLNPNLLYERNPIIVYEPIADPRHLLTTLFKYQYTFSREYITIPNFSYIAHSKFSILYCSDYQQATFKLVNPIHKKTMSWKPAKHNTYVSETNLEERKIPFVEIKMKQNQVLILPSHWILPSDMPLKKIDLADMTSKTFFYFSRP